MVILEKIGESSTLEKTIWPGEHIDDARKYFIQSRDFLYILSRLFFNWKIILLVAKQLDEM